MFISLFKSIITLCIHRTDVPLQIIVIPNSLSCLVCSSASGAPAVFCFGSCVKSEVGSEAEQFIVTSTVVAKSE